MSVLSQGAQVLDSSSEGLASGISQANDGAQGLASGAGSLADGATALSGGFPALGDGAQTLQDSLGDGATTIDASLPGDEEEFSEYVVDPVQVDDDVYGELDHFGLGFAPFFMTMALWLGALVIFFVADPFPARDMGANRFHVVFGLAALLLTLLLYPIGRKMDARAKEKARERTALNEASRAPAAV